MLNKEEIKVGDLIYHHSCIFQIKKIGKQTINVCDIYVGSGSTIRLDDVFFKINKKEAKRILLSECTRKAFKLSIALQNLKEIALGIGNLNDYIKYDTNQIEKDINDLIDRVKEVLGDK